MSIAKQRSASICLMPHPTGLGGPASFAARLTAALRRHGIEITADPLAPGVRAVLVMGGTRHLSTLWQARRRGIRIVQRLNGMNWVQRRRFTGLRHFFKAEIGNILLATTRRHLADRIIYQSHFTQGWWQRVYGPVKAAGRVIYNGVDLRVFSPEGPEQRPADRLRILMLEAHLGGGMEPGLENGVCLLQGLQAAGGQPWQLWVAGDVPLVLRQRWQTTAGEGLHFAGVIARDQVPALDRSAHMLFSADLNAACPNSVIEALACGLPVIAFATGALPEMVADGAGLVAPYGGDYWKLAPPQMPALVAAAQQIALAQPDFRRAARARAEAMFDIEAVVRDYLETLLD